MMCYLHTFGDILEMGKRRGTLARPIDHYRTT
jgi:hypothetical protein